MRPQGFLGGNVPDTAIGKFHRKSERKGALGFQVEPIFNKELRRIRQKDRRPDLDGLHFDLDGRLFGHEGIEQDNLFGHNPIRHVNLLGVLLHQLITLADVLRTRHTTLDLPHFGACVQGHPFTRCGLD